jgi:hypothetical protein
MRQVSPSDFPESWRAGEPTAHSYDSRHYQRRFMLRLGEEASNTLELLTQTFNRSAAEVTRQLITQANPEEFPQAARPAVRERKERADRQVLTHEHDLQRP